LLARPQDLGKQINYLPFATEMKKGDKVLVIVHQFPFAVVTVEGDYNYIRQIEPELGVWFRHFRRINAREVIYFADYNKNAKSWEQYVMVNAIQKLVEQDTKSYKLIEEMTKRV
jgi:hypothetical protein